MQDYWAAADEDVTLWGNLAAWGRFVSAWKGDKKQKIVRVKSGPQNFLATVLNIEKLKNIN